MFRLFQQFVLLLKINIFTEFIVSLFFVIKGGSSLLGNNITSTALLRWMEAVQIVVTTLMIPMLYLARSAVSTLITVKLYSTQVVILTLIFFFNISRSVLKVPSEWLLLSFFKSLSFSILHSCFTSLCINLTNGSFGFVSVCAHRHGNNYSDNNLTSSSSS